MDVTVVFGKEKKLLRVDPSLAALQTQIDEQLHVPPQFQRLLLRGKELKSAEQLTDGCKLLLLRNRAFHEAQPKGKQQQEEEEEQKPLAAVSQPKKAPSIDVDELDEDKLLVQVVRGKARYDLILPQSDSVLAVKKKLSGVLGLSPQALRLVVKGKTPKDDVRLDSLMAKRVVKCMALLQAQQHVVMEKEEELRELLNELASAQAALQRVKRQMARNFMAQDESLFELSRVLDDAQRVAGNLELVQQHLKSSKVSASETLDVVTQAIAEAEKLAEAAQELLESHSTV